MSEEEKPKRKYIKRRPMKKTSNLGKKYKIERDANGMASRGRTEWKKAMQVREGETFTEYENRTAYLRITNVNERERARKLKKGHKRHIKLQRKVTSRWHSDQLKIVDNRINVDMMKYYVPIMTWACIKFDMRKSDMEFCMGLYDKGEFSVAEFKAFGILYAKNSPRVFGDYLKKKYIIQFNVTNYTNLNRNPVDLYRLSLGMKKRVEAVMEKLTMTDTFNEKDLNLKGGKVEKSTVQMLEQMQREINDISMGKSEVEKL